MGMADNLDALGRNLKDESVDLVYLASIFTEAGAVVRSWLAWCGLGWLGSSDCDQHIDGSARLGVIRLGRADWLLVVDAGWRARRAGRRPASRWQQ
jgi:hypothetical protein